MSCWNWKPREEFTLFEQEEETRHEETGTDVARVLMITVSLGWLHIWGLATEDTTGRVAGSKGLSHLIILKQVKRKMYILKFKKKML